MEEAHHRRVVSYLRPEIKPGAVPVLCLCVPKPGSLLWDGTCRPPPVLIRPVSASNQSGPAPRRVSANLRLVWSRRCNPEMKPGTEGAQRWRIYGSELRCSNAGGLITAVHRPQKKAFPDGTSSRRHRHGFPRTTEGHRRVCARRVEPPSCCNLDTGCSMRLQLLLPSEGHSGRPGEVNLRLLL